MARTSCCASTAFEVTHETVRVSLGSGCKRKIARVITPNVPNAPVTSFGKSYPATFFTTLPPLLASVPSASATVTPINKSRSEPNRNRSAPLSLVDNTPPTVAFSAHRVSNASRCPCLATASCNFATVQPASTLIVKSAQACSSTRSSRAVDKITSARTGGFPHSSFVPPPRGITASLAALAKFKTLPSSCSLPGSTTKLGCTPATASFATALRTCLAVTIWRTSASNVLLRLTCEETPASIQNRSAIPAVSRGCATYSPGFSPHSRGRGKILLGFESCSGSNAHRTRCMVCKSGSLYIFDIIFFLSSPTPCSPVIDPPAPTHNSKSFLESPSAASSCPAILRSYKTNGCKFPTPAGNTFA